MNFGPQKKKLLTCILTHPSEHFSGDYISALRGCCALKFLYALNIELGYLAHTPTGTGVPQKNFNRENLKFGLKLSVCTSITSGLMGISSQIFYPDDVPRARSDNVGTTFDGLSPKIWEGKKTSKIFRDF